MRIEKTNHLVTAVNLRKQNGASLLEGIAYLGIAALVVLGAVSLLSSASSSAKANQMTNEVVALRTAVRKLYAGQGFTANVDLRPTLTSARAVPSTLQTSGSTITNSWNGSVTVSGTTTTTFTISYPNVPQDVCVSVLSGATDWTSVKGAGAAITAFPVSSANAVATCSGTTNTVDLIANS